MEEEDNLLRNIPGNYFHLDNICKYKRAGYFVHGQIIGEANLISGQHFKTEAQAKEDSYLISLSNKDFLRIFALEQQKVTVILSSLMKAFPIADISNLRRIAYDCDQRIYDINEFIFKQGDPCEFLFIIKKGEVQTARTIEVSAANSPPPTNFKIETLKSKR